MFRRIFIFFVVFSLALSGYAQELEDEEASQSMSGPRKQLATIIMAGLAGAVLGLSTLSFYGRPQEKLNNIAMGFAVGVIGGTVFTTYKAATAPTEFMGPQGHLGPPPKTPQLVVNFEF